MDLINTIAKKNLENYKNTGHMSNVIIVRDNHITQLAQFITEWIVSMSNVEAIYAIKHGEIVFYDIRIIYWPGEGDIMVGNIK